MARIRVTSLLPAALRDELERIVFFNPGQRAVAAPLVRSIHRYGVPTIVEEDGVLRFHVRAVGPVQTLYAFDDSQSPPRLVGVAMFTREKRMRVVLLHLAAHEDYTARGHWGKAWVVPYLVAAVRDASLRTRGVRELRILYPHEARLALRRAPATKPPLPVHLAR
jgi:hypothetical protein